MHLGHFWGIKFFFLSSFLIVAFFVNSTSLQAQSDSSVAVDVVPSNYGPNESVKIMLSSYSENLDTVPISWFLNGKSVSSGIGRKSFSATSPALGTTSTVLVKIVLPDGEIQKTISIRPNSTVLLWEAMDSYVPPFYKGKAMPTADSIIKIVAMPEIKAGSATIDPKSLIYSWKKDYSNETEGSGYGKNSFTYINDYLENSNIIEVTARTTSGEQSTTASINVGAVAPEISFYRKDAELGTIWDSEITDGYLIKDGESIVAVPYFISPKDIRRPDLIFNWSINGMAVSVENFRKNLIPLRVQEGTSGTSKLKLEIENSNKIFQTAEKEINLNF